MTIIDVMKELVDNRMEFRFSSCYGVNHIYIDGDRKHNGYVPQIRISVEDGAIYRRKCGIVGFVDMETLLKEIREL